MRAFFKFVIDFFQGWRRKTAVVTLTIALLFMIGWVRSFFYVDGLAIPSRSETAVHSFQSNQDGLSWVKELSLDNPDHWKDNQHIQIGSGRHSGQSVLNSLGAIRHKWLGFEVVNITYRHSNLLSGPNGAKPRGHSFFIGFNTVIADEDIRIRQKFRFLWPH